MAGNLKGFLKQKQQAVRWTVQALFFFIVLVVGYRFASFVGVLETGMIPGFERPPGVEAFLPISALVSLKHLLLTGSINEVHPSALIIFLMALFTTFLVKKGFCAWICPIGTVSELLNRLSLKVFTKSVKVVRPLDYLLRSLKYLLLGFFVWSVFVKMPGDAVAQFIQSPYHLFVDVRMLYFFTQISGTAMMILGGLIVLSFFIRHFWCRYLCPYGALLGLTGFLSVGSIKRDPGHCTQCGKCEKSCPGSVQIRKKNTVRSTECMACMSCVDHCPEEKAIGFSFFGGKAGAGAVTVALILCFVFAGGIFAAKTTGHWQNSIPKPAYLSYVVQTAYPWNTGEEIDPKTLEKMMTVMKNIRMQREKMMSNSSASPVN
jgi:polyferredoxin